MGVYYISACHDCKEHVMWDKCTREAAEEWHKMFHPGHNTQLSGDYDDDFYDTIRGYSDLGIRDGDTIAEVQPMIQKCDVCEKDGELDYDDINDRHMCERCWDAYYEACYYSGLT